MKYVLIFVVIVMLVRIDVILRLVDQVKLKIEPSPPNVESRDVKSNREVISIADDKSLQQTPRVVFLSLLRDFQEHPTAQVKERAMNQLKSNPLIFSKTKDPGFEAAIYDWRDLLLQKNREAASFLVSLFSLVSGENQELLRRFFTILLDVDVREFIVAYEAAKEPDCAIVTLFADAIPDEERINQYDERLSALDLFLSQENIDPSLRALGSSCQLVLKTYIEALSPEPIIEPEV